MDFGGESREEMVSSLGFPFPNTFPKASTTYQEVLEMGSIVDGLLSLPACFRKDSAFWNLRLLLTGRKAEEGRM